MSIGVRQCQSIIMVLGLGFLAVGCGNDAQQSNSGATALGYSGSLAAPSAIPAATAGVSGSATAGDTFKPCPATGDCKILPLGDSITYGLQSPDSGGYRSALFHLTLMNSKHVTFVGSQRAGPAMVDGKPFANNNEGYSGWTI